MHQLTRTTEMTTAQLCIEQKRSLNCAHSFLARAESNLSRNASCNVRDLIRDGISCVNEAGLLKMNARTVKTIEDVKRVMDWIATLIVPGQYQG